MCFAKNVNVFYWQKTASFVKQLSLRGKKKERT